MFQRPKPKHPVSRFHKQFVSSGANSNDPEEPATHPLFPVAVFIMGIVSCYTTALGLAPMLDNLFLSYAMAFALSIFMIAIALQFPKSYISGTQHRLILGYSMVAIFSVLLNFNAIYGIFASEKLLYNELKENKQHLLALKVKAEESLNVFFDAEQTELELREAKALLEEEKTNPNDLGYGEKARRINTEAVIPLQAKLDNIKNKYEPLLVDIDTTVASALTIIDGALASAEISDYRKAVDVSIDAYTAVGAKTANMIADGSFTYEPLSFQHRDVGHLNHSLWSLGHLGQMDGKQVSALLVSLLLAILIDFIVLFVLVLLHSPGKKELLEEKPGTLISPGNGRSYFQQPLRQSRTQEAETPSSIYAKRSYRGKTETPVVPENQQDLVDIDVRNQIPVEKPVHITSKEEVKLNGRSMDWN